MMDTVKIAKVAAASVAAALLAGAGAAPAWAIDVTQQQLVNSDQTPENWLHSLGNYSAQRYSRLNEINRDNVANLKAAFTIPVPTGLVGTTIANLQNPPLVIDGIMTFNDGWGTMYKVDVRDPKKPQILFVTDPAVDKAGPIGNLTRGHAVWGNLLLENLVDGRAVAIDYESGEIVWDKQVARTEENWEFDGGEGFTAAPIAAEGKLLVGQSKGDRGTRGWLAALDIANGEELWRTYTVPAPGEPGSETWKDDHNAWHTGGGSLWTTGSYDPDQHVTIWGTANPVPMFDPEFRPGDNLFTNSAIAFNMDDGSMKWYFQYTPNESWDYDENGVHFLFDANINGENRKAVGHFARNGYFYALDRTNGQYINAGQFVDKITWTAGIDPKTGKPVEYDPNLDVQTYIPATRNSRANPNVAACPTPAGGVRWQPPAYNPDKMIAWSGGADGCTEITVKFDEPVGPEGGNPKGVGKSWLGGTGNFNSPFGYLVAMNVTNGQQVNKIRLPHENQSGVLATAGGVLFTGEIDGVVTAYNDETLEVLWQFPTSISIKAPAMSYAVNGKQYIAIMAGGAAAPNAYPDLSKMQAGSMLYVFSL